MTLRNSKYKDRLLDKRLEKHLRAFGAVEITGTMWCGKTWMSEAHAESKINLSNVGTRSLIEADPSLAFEGGKPHVIDEWQEIPQFFAGEPGSNAIFINCGLMIGLTRQNATKYIMVSGFLRFPCARSQYIIERLNFSDKDVDVL